MIPINLESAENFSQKETHEKDNETDSEVIIPKKMWKRKPFSDYSSEREERNLVSQGHKVIKYDH